MNRAKLLERKVAFLNIIAVILVVLAITFMIINQLKSNHWDTYVDKEKKLLNSVNTYKNASDYMTQKAFAYVGSANIQYYESYINEAYITKRREMAVANIKTADIGQDIKGLITLINNYSMELMELEIKAFDLMKLGKIDEAKQILFSGEYEDKSNRIAREVEKFEALVKADVKKDLSFLELILDFTFAGEIVISVLIAVISPLRNKTTTELLYIDSLTNKGNRIAFDKYINRYEDKIKGIAFLDANGLKTVNDTLGHKAGDALLVNIAECIQRVFKKYGRLYRISGDEFVVVLNKDIDEKHLLNEFEKECDAMSKKTDSHISASCGFAIQNAENPVSKDDLYFISEQNMYLAKAEYYKKSGIDRRTN